MNNVKRKGIYPVLIQKKHKEMEYLTFSGLEQTGIVTHLFSTRIGGVSKGIYSESNFSYTRGDVPEDVDENFRRISEIMGHEGSLEDFVCTYQTHTTNIKVIKDEDRGKGVCKKREYVDIDGLITNVRGIILTTYHADCPPVYLVDTKNKAIGLCHSGWKGTLGEIAVNAIKAMNKEYGTDAKDIHAAIGPSICKDCYEISSDVAEKFIEKFGLDTLYSIDALEDKENGKYQLGLWNIIKNSLLNAGVPQENIETTDICTCCNPDYLFSHRVQHEDRGNLAAFLCLK
ncbi:MAG: peptidoglycan editing factor PgeF [Butyrivibrio sp.]|nr:peptidoglycan editing factor PgeF [Butyrivibrio sp.]